MKKWRFAGFLIILTIILLSAYLFVYFLPTTIADVVTLSINPLILTIGWILYLIVYVRLTNKLTDKMLDVYESIDDSVARYKDVQTKNILREIAKVEDKPWGFICDPAHFHKEKNSYPDLYYQIGEENKLANQFVNKGFIGGTVPYYVRKELTSYDRLQWFSAIIDDVVKRLPVSIRHEVPGIGVATKVETEIGCVKGFTASKTVRKDYPYFINNFMILNMYARVTEDYWSHVILHEYGHALDNELYDMKDYQAHHSFYEARANTVSVILAYLIGKSYWKTFHDIYTPGNGEFYFRLNTRFKRFPPVGEEEIREFIFDLLYGDHDLLPDLARIKIENLQEQLKEEGKYYGEDLLDYGTNSETAYQDIERKELCRTSS